jgi:integrase
MKRSEDIPAGTKPPTETRVVADPPVAKARKHRTGYIFKRGGVYWLEYTVYGKRFRKSLHTSDLSTAKVKRTEIMAPFTVASERDALETVKQRLESLDRAGDSATGTSRDAVTISNAFAAYEAAPNRPQAGAGTLTQYRAQHGRFLRWMSSHHPEILEVRHVTQRMADDYASDLSNAGFSPNTFNKHIRFLMLLFRVLSRRSRTLRNPWTDIVRKKQMSESRRELTTDELRSVLTSASDELRTLFAVGIYTGMRLRDCATLRWAEVDLSRRIILRVPSKVARSANARPIHVPIHPVLLSVLQKARPTSGAVYVVPALAEAYLKSSDNVTDRIQRHFLECGIDVHKKGTGVQMERNKAGKPIRDKKGRLSLVRTGKRAVVEVGFHSLRHTFVSLCRVAGAPLAVVEAIVGHSNPAMTRHYTHVSELAANQAVAALPALTADAEAGAQAQTTDLASSQDLLAKVREIAERGTGKGWARAREQILDMIPPPSTRQK